MRKVLVTGANGFIGRALCFRLLELGYEVYAVVRKLFEPIDGVKYLLADLENVEGLDIQGLEVDCIVHLAGRAHMLGEQNKNAIALYRAANCDATLQLARLAIASGVGRFVFISSIGVNGAETQSTAFNEQSAVVPHADYAISKYEAELELKSVLEDSSVELVIVRPPLVYDVAAPGNFARLLRLVSSGLPLPLANIRNSRSMVSLRNLVDFLALCIWHPNAAKELFLVSDDRDVSTSEIIELLCKGMGKRAYMFSLPSRLVLFGAKLVGRQNLHTQLFCSLQVDSSKARRLLGWEPGESVDDALVRVGRSWRDKRGGAKR